MNCCGNKRETLAKELQNKIQMEVPVSDGDFLKSNRNSSDSIFMLTGISSLTIKSFLGGHLYHFTHDNPEVLVKAEDVPMMRGYSDLKEIS